METIHILTFGCIGLAGLAIYFRGNDKLSDAIMLLVGLAVASLMTKNIDASENRLLPEYILISYISLNFLLSRFKMLSEKKWGPFIPLITTSVLFAAGSTVYSFNGFEFSFSLPVVFLVVLGTVGQLIVNEKVKLFEKLIGDDTTGSLKTSLLIFFVGLSAFLGTFFASHYGIFLVSVGLLTASFFDVRSNKNLSLALMLLSIMPIYTKMVGIETVELTFGKTLEGIFFGLFVVVFIHSMSQAKSKQIVSVLFSIVFSCLLIFGLILLVTQKTDFGGVDAFCGVLVGIALGISLYPSFKLATVLSSFVIAGGIFLAPMTVNKEEQEMMKMSVVNVDDHDNDIDPKSEVQSPFDMEGQSMDSIIGSYKIDPNTVKLNFELGPKGGITKGAFRTFTGNVKIASTIENSTFDILLPVAELTTFNQYRDESLVEKEYFNLAQFPTMSYTSTKMVKDGDHYELLGKFTMLGVSKPLTVELKYIGTVESKGKQVPVLVGKSIIDRTQFGMKPDAKEGNKVSFEFKVELIK